jgi:hypothetical protein
MFKRALMATIALLSIASHATADVMVGTPTADPAFQDCIAFGCGVHAQFIFDSSYFSGPISITELQFFNSDQDPTGDNFEPGTYTFRLSTSANDFSTPDAVFANNLGPDVQLFATVVIGSNAIPPVFSFAGTPFTYDPANGDLLLEIDKTGTNNSFSGFTDYNADQGFKVSRVWSFDNGPTGNVDINFGPVTNFTTTAVSPSPVPEPMTLTLTGLGLAGIAARRLKKSRNQN